MRFSWTIHGLSMDYLWTIYDVDLRDKEQYLITR